MMREGEFVFRAARLDDAAAVFHVARGSVRGLAGTSLSQRPSSG
jgi:hypothetical protein